MDLKENLQKPMPAKAILTIAGICYLISWTTTGIISNGIGTLGLFLLIIGIITGIKNLLKK